MISRASWFVAGAAAGAIGASYSRRKVKAVAGQMAPVHVARTVVVRARVRGQDLVEAIREGRSAMRAKEVQLRAGRDVQAITTAPPPAQIIVLSDVRQLEELTRAARQPRRRGREPKAPLEHPATRGRHRR